MCTRGSGDQILYHMFEKGCDFFTTDTYREQNACNFIIINVIGSYEYSSYNRV